MADMDYQDPIIIVGCPRSGTSLTAGIIEACGAFGGRSVPSDRRNPKGYFENENLTDFFNFIVQKMEDLALSVGISTLLDAIDKDVFFNNEHVRAKVREILAHEGYKGGPWYFKYPSAINCPSLLSSNFPNARWLIVRRNEADIRASIQKAGMFRSTPMGIDAVSYYLDFSEVKEVAPGCAEIWPFAMLAQGVSKFRPLIEQLGLTWNEEAVRAFADRKLVHNDDLGLFHS